MQPTYLHMRGINSLRDLTADLTTVPEGLCAIVGGNGAGKTTLLEVMLPAAVWLDMPTRPGNLSDSCTGRDSMIELRHITGGQEFRHVVTVDVGPTARSRPSTEAYLYVDGASVNDGKLGTYREQVEALLPPQHLVMASAFAAQDGSGSFAELDVHGRRKLFQSMLGLSSLQRIADRAKLHRQPLDAMAAQLDRDGARLDSDVASAAELDTQIDTEALRTEGLRYDVAAARDAFTARQADHATQAALLQQLDTARADALSRRAVIEREIDTADRQWASANSRWSALIATAARGDEVRARVARRDQLRAEYAECTTEYRVANADAANANEAARVRAASRARAARDLQSVRAQLDHAAQAAGDIDDMRSRVAQLDRAQSARAGLDRAAQDARGAWMQADQEQRTQQQDATQALQTARAELQRAERDAGQLDGVPCGGRKIWDAGSADDQPRPPVPLDCRPCPMLGTAAEARDALPRLSEALQDAEKGAAAARDASHGVADLQAASSDATKALRDCDAEISRLAGARSALASAEDVMGRRATLEASAAELTESVAQLDAESTSESAALTAARARVHAANDAGQRVSRELREFESVDADLSAVIQAEASIPILAQSMDTHADAKRRATEQLAAVTVPPAPEAQRAVVDAHRARVESTANAAEAAQERLEVHLATLSRLRGRRQALGDLSARVAALSADREGVARRRAGLVLVERAFGPEGIQALEIDAAGPGVSGLCNELLGTVDAPYTVQLRTVREATSTRKQREVFDVLVHDGRTGTSRELSRMSGGERVLVNEAIKLGIAVHVAQRTGRGMQTLWRDECDGALSDEMATRYPDMLRAAMRLGGFTRCYFITHRPAAAVQADSVLPVRDGVLGVVDPGEYAAALGQ